MTLCLAAGFKRDRRAGPLATKPSRVNVYLFIYCLLLPEAVDLGVTPQETGRETLGRVNPVMADGQNPRAELA
jgi:hypothetical protein